MQFGWPPVSPAGASGNNGNGPISSGSNGDRIAIDPALSSVRSSVAQPGKLEAPELRFPDETLASATASPGGHDVMMPDLGQGDGGDDGDMLSPGDERKDQPFSRSPELRVSHKLAERKRRKEMKDLFDELRELLPAERGTKSSKWEILSKSIDFIAHLKNVNGEMSREMDKVRRELEITRNIGGQYNFSQIPPTYPPPASYPPAGPSGAAAGQSTSSPTAVQQVAPPRSG